MDTVTSFTPSSRVKDIRGQKFGRLTALNPTDYRYRGYVVWECSCSCGKSALVSYSKLVQRYKTHCGCKRGIAKHPLYMTWANMMRRCYDSSEVSFKYYGGRGIKVCDRWHTPENFFADMHPKTSLIHTLDREKNDGNYEPTNCRWSTPKEQCLTRRKRIKCLSANNS